jgi:hypothetical protein
MVMVTILPTLAADLNVFGSRCDDGKVPALADPCGGFTMYYVISDRSCLAPHYDRASTQQPGR